MKLIQLSAALFTVLIIRTTAEPDYSIDTLSNLAQESIELFENDDSVELNERTLFKKKTYGYGKGKAVRPTYTKKSFARPVYTKKAPVRPVYSKKAPVTKTPVCKGKGCSRYLFAKKKSYGYGKGKAVRPTYTKKSF
eukprot:Selendium_serpulae@DN5898_c2_g1_i17.p1